MTPTSVGITGLGAIGGSLALALHHDPSYTVAAWAPDSHDRDAAARRGLHVAESLPALASASDIVVLAIPLDAIATVARSVLTVAERAIVVHTGSLQSAAAAGLDDELAARVFGAHPIAGTHATGFEAARADLFRGATISVEARASAADREVVAALWRAAGAARIDVRDAAAHDAHMAWVSHLPQLLSTALAHTLAGAHIAPEALGPGARDTTRLAQSAFEMWHPILAHAPAETRRALRSAAQAITSIEHSLAAGDLRGVERVWENARRWRRGVERA